MVKPKRCVDLRPWTGLVLLALTLSACTSNKARGMQVDATQFSAASSHAIDGFAELDFQVTRKGRQVTAT
ncbi:MAG: hypothetical protein GDA49_11955 [Rhodospirillales bacterium]|nr:hypothetical protein [Rhodospirillales bacterium]